MDVNKILNDIENNNYFNFARGCQAMLDAIGAGDIQVDAVYNTEEEDGDAKVGLAIAWEDGDRFVSFFGEDDYSNAKIFLKGLIQTERG